ADAFGSLGLLRRTALWQVLAAPEGELPLFAGLADDEIAPPLLNAMPAADEVAADYRTTGLSLKFHPLELVRSTLTGMGVTTAKTLANTPASTRLQVAGLVLVRQCPATAKGTIFMTLEDETGTANLIVCPRVWERYRRVAGRA